MASADPLWADQAPLAAQPHAIAMIDVGHFKQLVTDNHGHLVGDELLLLSRLMRRVSRVHARLDRFGGEERVALMRRPGDAQAGQVPDRLRSLGGGHLLFRNSAPSRMRWVVTGGGPAPPRIGPSTVLPMRSIGPRAMAAARSATMPPWWPGATVWMN